MRHAFSFTVAVGTHLLHVSAQRRGSELLKTRDQDLVDYRTDAVA